jgi:hypothetical protein
MFPSKRPPAAHAASQYRVLFDLVQGLAGRPRQQWTEKDCRNTMRSHTPNRTGSSWTCVRLRIPINPRRADLDNHE